MNPEITGNSTFTQHSFFNFRIIRRIVFFTLITTVVSGVSQTFEVGAFGGDSYYLGDLNPGVHFQHPQFAFGVLMRYNLDTRWAVKLSGSMGKVTGSSESSTFLDQNGLTFESRITDISGTVEFNFFDYFTGSKREYFTPYIYTGFGFFWFDPTSKGQSLKAAGTEGQNVGYDGRKPYATLGVNIPFGLGVKLSLSKRFCLLAFWEMHKTFTDYIDDISKTYYLKGTEINPGDQASVLSDPTRNHAPGMERGNPRSKDWYSFSGLALTYKFTIRSSKKCKDVHHK